MKIRDYLRTATDDVADKLIAESIETAERNGDREITAMPVFSVHLNGQIDGFTLDELESAADDAIRDHAREAIRYAGFEAGSVSLSKLNVEISSGPTGVIVTFLAFLRADVRRVLAAA